MSLRSRRAPEIRPRTLTEALLGFEQVLTDDQKAAYSICCGSLPPSPADVIRLTIDINQRVAQNRKFKKFLNKKYLGISLSNILEAIQKFSSAVDTFVGGSQIASAIWGVIKISLQTVSDYASYSEKLVALFMHVGRTCPRNREFGDLYPNSPKLQKALDEYYIVMVQLCKKSLNFLRQGPATQFWDSIVKSFDSEFGKFRDDLNDLASAVDGQVVVELNKVVVELNKVVIKESEENHEHRVANIKIRAKKAELKFLTACSTYNHNAAWKRGRKQGDTAWVFHKDEYKQWRQEKNSGVLWCCGELGSGKTVLSANIVQDLLSSHGAVVSFFFCRYDEPISLNVRTIVGSIARQIFEGVKSEIPNFAAEVDGVEVGTLDSDQILEYLEKLLPGTRTYLILIDGMDECDEEDIKSLIDYLQRLLESKYLFQIYCSSRQDVFHRVSAPLKPRLRKLNLTVSDLNSEIDKHVKAELDLRLKSGNLILIDPTIEDEIRRSLVEKAQGMFLWVAFQLEEISSQHTDADRLRVLQELPIGLPKTFNRILRKLQSSEFANPSLSKKIFSLVAAAKQPLKVEELQIAISIESGQTEWDTRKLFSDMTRPLHSCGSLLVFDEDDLTVRFAHQSVKQHFLAPATDSEFSGYHMNPLEIDTNLGELLVTYLNFDISTRDLVIPAAPSAPKVNKYPSDILNRTLPANHISTKIALKVLKAKGDSSHDVRPWLEETARQTVRTKFSMPPEYNLLIYAKKYWLQHSKFFGRNEDTYTWWKRLVDGESTAVDLPWTTPKSCTEWIVQNKHWALIVRTLGLLLSAKPIKTRFLSADPSQYAKIELLLKALPNTKAVTPSLAKDYEYLVWQAAETREQKIIEVLLAKGVNLNGADKRGKTSLVAAARSGSMSLVQLLLDNGADASGRPGELSLVAAIQNGSTELIQLLLDNGADASGRKGTKPLVAAAETRSTSKVQLLLDYGADASGMKGVESLTAAAQSGATEVVRLLLKNGADASGRKGAESLVSAAENGITEIVQMLLENGTDVNALIINQSALQKASSDPKNEKVVRLLLDNGANVNATARYGNALRAAVSNPENEELVRLLIEHERDANNPVDLHSDPLLTASVSSEDQETQQFYYHKVYDADNRVDIHAVPSSMAMNHLERRLSEDTELRSNILEGLLEYHSSMDEYALYYGNELQSTAYLYGSDVLLLLLDKGEDVNAQGGFYGTAIQAAAASKMGSSEKIDLLLKHGARINIQGGIFGNPLQAAACMSNETVLHRLLEMGADVNAQGGAFGNALQAAAFCCDEISVRSLLKRRANINTSGGYYGNALQAATVSHKKPNEKVQLLLESGANPNLSGGYYGSALQAAAVSYKKFNKSFELLLNAGANINAQGGRFGSALQAVAATKTTKSLERLKLLLHRGANVNAEGGWYGNALQVAAYHNNKVAVELLLQNKADILAKGGRMKNVLVASIAHTLYNKDREELVGLILKKGAKAKAPKDWYDIALDGDIFKKLHRITHEKHVHEKYVQLVRDAREARRFPKSFKSSK